MQGLLGPGDAAPVGLLVDENGESTKVPARGRPNVLVFYRGDW
jgi:peroxiredoxin